MYEIVVTENFNIIVKTKRSTASVSIRKTELPKWYSYRMQPLKTCNRSMETLIFLCSIRESLCVLAIVVLTKFKISTICLLWRIWGNFIAFSGSTSIALNNIENNSYKNVLQALEGCGYIDNKFKLNWNFQIRLI